MKFCQKCGKEIMDEAVVCPGCGCEVTPTRKQTHGDDGLAIASKIFMILGCISSGWLIIPLAWTLPITISIWGKLNRGESVGTALKIVTLLFVNFIGGILLLCRSDEQN